MKVTSQQAVQALKAQKGNGSWSEFAANAKRDDKGTILISRPKSKKQVAGHRS